MWLYATDILKKRCLPVEGCVLRVHNYRGTHSLMALMQSAYNSYTYHSVESAVLRVQRYILQAVDQKKCALLMLLDLSAPFDTTDHDILLHVFSWTLVSSGWRWTGLGPIWISAYNYSLWKLGTSPLSYGPWSLACPRGRSWARFFSPPSQRYIARPHNYGLEEHLYADDTQLYLRVDTNAVADGTERVKACVQDIRQWMVTNKLRLVVLLMTSPVQRNSWHYRAHHRRHLHQNLRQSEQPGCRFRSTPRYGGTYQHLNMEGHISTSIWRPILVLLPLCIVPSPQPRSLQQQLL